MSFYEAMKLRYEPHLTAREFSDMMNALEIELFNGHPEYLELSEAEQNKHIEDYYRKKNVRH